MSKFTHQNILCDEIYFLITNYETILNDISFSICRGNFRHIFVNVSFVLSENKKVTQIRSENAIQGLGQAKKTFFSVTKLVHPL